MPSKTTTSIIMTAVGVAVGLVTYYRTRDTRKSASKTKSILSGIFASGATVYLIAFCENSEECALALPASVFLSSVAVMNSTDD